MAACTDQSSATYDSTEGRMYHRPILEKFGPFRELTRLGSSVDCDGGVNGINPGTPADGSSTNCPRATSS